MDYRTMDGAITSIDRAEGSLKSVYNAMNGSNVILSSIGEVNSAKTRMKTKLSNTRSDLEETENILKNKANEMKAIEALVKAVDS